MIVYGLAILLITVVRGCEDKIIGAACTCTDYCLGNSLCQHDGKGGFACLCLPCQHVDDRINQCISTPDLSQPCVNKCLSNLVCIVNGNGTSTCQCPATQIYDVVTKGCVTIPGFNESCQGVCQSNLECRDGKCQCPSNLQWNAQQGKCVPIPGFGESCQGVCQSNLECRDGKCQCPNNLQWNAQQGKCVPIPTPGFGESCNDVCQSNLECRNKICQCPGNLQWDSQQGRCVQSSQACIDSTKGCAGLPNGDYPKCYPECQKGYFVACSNGYTYDMPCADAYYAPATPGGQRTVHKMVYDPATKSCQRKAAYCPRPLDSQVEQK